MPIDFSCHETFEISRRDVKFIERRLGGSMGGFPVNDMNDPLAPKAVRRAEIKRQAGMLVFFNLY